MNSPPNSSRAALSTWIILVILLAVAVAVVGLLMFVAPQLFSPKTGGYADSGNYGYGGDVSGVAFNDDAKTNTTMGADKLQLTFTDQTGTSRKISDYLNDKHVVLVFMRGWAQSPAGICPYCGVQTSRLIKNHKKFEDRNAQVLVVFPGNKTNAKEFVEYSMADTEVKKLPFPLLMDTELKAVDQLGIREDQAKPSTFILDKKGQLRFAYVGETSVDRPSLSALFKQLEMLESEQ